MLVPQIKRHLARLEPLRSGASLVSEEELAQLDANWAKWRGEWQKRKKVFNKYVHAFEGPQSVRTGDPFALSILESMPTC